MSTIPKTGCAKLLIDVAVFLFCDAHCVVNVGKEV